jgi:hypothetical protein
MDEVTFDCKMRRQDSKMSGLALSQFGFGGTLGPVREILSLELEECHEQKHSYNKDYNHGGGDFHRDWSKRRSASSQNGTV